MLKALIGKKIVHVYEGQELHGNFKNFEITFEDGSKLKGETVSQIWGTEWFTPFVISLDGKSIFVSE
jgi:hypothetical protein